MSFSSVNIISFDATGTLFDPFPSIGAIYAEVLQEHGVYRTEPELEMRFIVEFHKSRQHTPEEINEKSERKRWKKVVRGVLEDDYSKEIFNSLWERLGSGDCWKPKIRIRRTLKALAEDGNKLIITSNWDHRLYGILNELGLTPYFDNIFISSELGVEKPSESVFMKVADALGASPSTLLHIGNSEGDDFLPALRAGWNALLLHNRIPHGMEHGSVLGSLDQLPEVLQSEQAVRS